MIQEALRTILVADSGVTALTSQISHGIANQEDIMPFITFLVFDTSPNETKDTLSQTDVISVSISCFSQNNLNAVSIAEAVRTALDGYTGTENSTTIESSTFEKQRDAWLPQAKAFQITVEFQLFIKR
jgi:hypothetical protein